MNPLRYLLRFLFLSLPGAIVSLLAIEGVLRLLGYTPYYLDGRAFIPSQNGELVYELRPGFEGLYAGTPISINSQGFRGKELSDHSGESLFRVVVVGDSIAFGQGVREEETLPGQLASQLQGKLATLAEVVNLGVPGYDTCQEYLRFKEQVLSLNPQVALLVYSENDTDSPVFQVNGNAVVSPDVRTGLFGDLMAAARRHSMAYNWAWTRWQVLKRPTFTIAGYREILANKFEEGSPGWERSKACLEQAISLAQAHSVQFSVIPFPVLAWLDQKPYPFMEYIERVCQAALAAEAECLDVVPLLQDAHIRLMVNSAENHPSADVYARIAEEIVAAIAETGGIP